VTPALLLTGALVLLAGLAIGATSIGGVLVVPALTLVAGVPLPQAIAATSLGFLLVAGWTLRLLRAQHQALPPGLPPLLGAALAGAVVGAWLVPLVPARWVQGWIGVLALASGLYGWFTAGRVAHGHRRWPGAAVNAGLGLLVGAGSALSGTGGPVLLLPLLLLAGLPAAPAVLAALAVQVPIALASVVTHGVLGTLGAAQWPLGLAVGALLVGGAHLGARLARRASPAGLRRATAVVLVLTGLAFLVA
jgi:uncharacterized membrane protein YfcA